jgi:hypothetical protein
MIDFLGDFTGWLIVLVVLVLPLLVILGPAIYGVGMRMFSWDHSEQTRSQLEPEPKRRVS